MGNPYKAKSSKKSAPKPQSPEPVVEAPAGTIGSILEWVGQDPERALLALEQEEASDKPRKSLTTQLEEIIDA